MKKKILLPLLVTFLCGEVSAQTQNKPQTKLFSEDLMQGSCTFETTGRNSFFVLEPGFQLILEGSEGTEKVKLVITVLNETKKIGNTETRIVEENETANGVTVEISINYFSFLRRVHNMRTHKCCIL